MGSITLAAPADAHKLLATLVRRSSTLQIEVMEDRCFAGTWVSIGDVEFFASAALDDLSLSKSLQNGEYTWHLPELSAITAAITDAIPSQIKENDRARIDRIVSETLQDISRRLSLLFPTFDADSIGDFPLRKPTTIVVDTSAVLQGGLDFASRFLYPMARIKVPAVVSLEIRNMADRFLSLRRAPRLRYIACLQDHVKSQGGERALMRVEWHSEVEVERPAAGTDPLRIIFQADTDTEVRDLSLSSVQRSFADRLIFESAKGHQAQHSGHHPVSLMTSDQGLARMALAEGMHPLYFEARKTSSPFATTLTGVQFHPFHSGLYSIGFAALLWEVATCFGAVRVRTPDGDASFCVTALAEGLVWYPYHARGDLLWCELDITSRTSVPAGTQASAEIPDFQEHSGATDSEVPAYEPAVQGGEPAGTRQSLRVGAYGVNIPRLIELVRRLSTERELSEEAVLETLNLSSHGAYKEYRGFLTSAQVAVATPTGVQKTPELDLMWAALRSADAKTLYGMLLKVPAFEAFLDFIRQYGRSDEWQRLSPIREKVIPTYRTLAEIVCAAVAIPNRGICLTDLDPSVAEFAELALAAYNSVKGDDPWVLTGEWLEELAWNARVHPVIARSRLEEAYQAGYINRFVEGSTPDSRFDTHAIDVLEVRDGEPVIHRYSLYRGDFLETQRSSVRIRIEPK